MILTALNNYYDRLFEQGNPDIAPYGFSQEKISHALVINKEGELLDVMDLRDTSGKKPVPVRMPVPKFAQKTSGIKPYFLWEKSGYLLGVSGSQKQRTTDEFTKFKKFHLGVLEPYENEEEFHALCLFLRKWNPDVFRENKLFHDNLLDQNMVFRLDGNKRFIHQHHLVLKIWEKIVTKENPRKGVCMVSGEIANIARIHPSIKGVVGAKSSGAFIASFNENAFLSYAGTTYKNITKKKENDTGVSAPVSLKCTFAYTTVLNHLLRKEKSNYQRLEMGDTTVVFWAEASDSKQSAACESLFSLFIDPPVNDDQEINKLHSALAIVKKGRPISDLDPELHTETRIFVLGLAPNSSRLSIRFWETQNLDVFTKRLAQHYQDLFLEPVPLKQELAVRGLLREVVPHREGSKPKIGDAPPQLAGELVRSILAGTRYPRSLLTIVLLRMRADGDISYLRVALCKAVLVRDARLNNNQDKEIPVSLDTENQNPGYLLGRLFASLESCQRAAIGKKINATIRDRFGAASMSPASVFPRLLRNNQHHVSKIKKGEKPWLAGYFDKQIGEIFDKLTTGFPKILTMEDQGRFFIGYYHQREDRFTTRESKTEQGEDK